jgi:hypothetical protein
MARRFWTLKVSRFESEAPYDPHWYGSLWVEGVEPAATRDGCRLEYVMTAEHATTFNTQDSWASYTQGATSERFLTREELLAAAMKEFEKRAQNGDVLVLREVIATKGQI